MDAMDLTATTRASAGTVATIRACQEEIVQALHSCGKVSRASRDWCHAKKRRVRVASHASRAGRVRCLVGFAPQCVDGARTKPVQQQLLPSSSHEVRASTLPLPSPVGATA